MAFHASSEDLARVIHAHPTLAEALKDFSSAYEIRSELAEDPDAPEDLPLLVSRDLMEIGELHARLGQTNEALKEYQKALDWRTRDVDLKQPQNLLQLRRIVEPHLAISGVHEKEGDTTTAIDSVERAAVPWQPGGKIAVAEAGEHIGECFHGKTKLGFEQLESIVEQRFVTGHRRG
jgi:tetratricopeptide (TPR) repeat protein